MGSKTRGPKAEDYKPTETEQTAAAIAKADADYFANTYDPLLVEMRDKTATEDVGSTLRGTANADTMQALTGNLDLGVAQNMGAAADLATGAVGQMLAANVATKDAKIDQQTGVLGTARGQRADTGDALSQAARMASSTDLNRIQNKQALRRARRGALMDTAMAAGSQMGKNIADTSNLFIKQSANLSRNMDGDLGYKRYGLGKNNKFKLLSQPRLNDQAYAKLQGFEDSGDYS